MKALFPLFVPALALPLLAAAPAPAKPTVVLGDIRLQLYQAYSGTFSQPVGPNFSFWNTGAGEGDAKEPADDFLVSVALITGSDESISSETRLTLTVRNAAGKVLATTTSKYQLVPYKNRTHVALWLRDSSCAGKITATATYGKQVKRAVYGLDCGE